MLISFIAVALATHVTTYEVNVGRTKAPFSGLDSLVVDPAQAITQIQPLQPPFSMSAEKVKNEAKPGEQALVFTNPMSNWGEFTVNGAAVGTIGPYATARLEGLKPGMYKVGVKLPTGLAREFAVRIGAPPRQKVPVLVRLGENRIELSDKIYFEFDSAIIETDSHALLDAVADLLGKHPEVLKVSIEGHTDSRGAEDYNQKLSDARAAAVRDYLVGKGVTGDRLASAGFGESRPVNPADSEEAWETNRRVEFNITQRAEPVVEAPPVAPGKKIKGAGKTK